MDHEMLPKTLTGGGVIMGFTEFMDGLKWIGEHADGLGLLLSIIGVFGGLWLQHRRNKILEKKNSKP